MRAKKAGRKSTKKRPTGCSESSPEQDSNDNPSIYKQSPLYKQSCFGEPKPSSTFDISQKASTKKTSGQVYGKGKMPPEEIYENSRTKASSGKLGKYGKFDSSQTVGKGKNTSASNTQVRKKRFRPGTVALREIKKLQNQTELIIPKLPF